MIAHGTILGGLSTVPDLDLALAAYRDVLGLDLVEQGTVAAELALSWGAHAITGARFAALRPRSGAPCWLRLVEQPDHPAFVATTTYGWAAFELSVQDVYGWPARLAGSGFDIVGPPRTITGIEPAFIPMQVLGPGREMLYLNQVLTDMPALDLPRATSPVDKMFIVILAAPERTRAVAWYQTALGFEPGADFMIPYTMINRAFGLPGDHLTTLTMIKKERLPIVEIDDYPAGAAPRGAHAGMLPPGNALVSLAVTDLAACRCAWITQPSQPGGALYEGRRSATTRGMAGELIELIEVGS